MADAVDIGVLQKRMTYAEDGRNSNRLDPVSLPPNH